MEPTYNPYQQPQNQPAPDGNSVQPSSSPNLYQIKQDFKFGRESFSVTNGQNVVCVAKRKIMAIKEHLDVYQDEAATQLLYSIQQASMVAISMTYDVVSTNGQKLGAFRLHAMESILKEHWDILGANDNPMGVIDQDTATAIEGRIDNIIPQTFVAKINDQPVCTYREELNIGMFFRMDIDFSSDTQNQYDRTLGIAAAILLASKHMNTK